MAANKIIEKFVKAAKKDPSIENVHKVYVEGKRALKGDTPAQQELFRRLKEVQPAKGWYGKGSYANDPKPERKPKASAEPAPVKSAKADGEGYLLDAEGKRIGHVDPEIDKLMRELDQRVNAYVQREREKAEKAAKGKAAKAAKDAKANAKRTGLVLDVDGNIIGAEDPALNALVQAGLRATAPKAKRTSKKASK